MPVTESAKRLGAYATPTWLVDVLVHHTLPAVVVGQRVRVLDPACGDGRFLVAAADALRRAGAVPVLVGIDVDRDAISRARCQVERTLGPDVDVELVVGDALADAAPFGGDGCFDVVIGNPPFLSQLATSTARGGASRHGGGPYADAAAEFLALAVRAARPDGGRVGLVLPQSLLASRDAAPVRAEVDRLATMVWSWWSPRPAFDGAHVLVCALAFERSDPSSPVASRPWTHVVAGAVGVPVLPTLRAAGTVGDRARLTANFRDQYYALVPAVVEDGTGPPLVTSGLVDPGRCRWGERRTTFARRRYLRPTVELAALSDRMRRWADDLLVPKVLIANQSRIIEAVVDAAGEWVPGVPVITARPADATVAWEVAAVLTSPVASAWAWHRAAGTGLSATSLRLGPRWLAELPWPAGDVTPAVDALVDGDVAAAGQAVTAAYGLDVDDAAIAALHEWWFDKVPT